MDVALQMALTYLENESLWGGWYGFSFSLHRHCVSVCMPVCVYVCAYSSYELSESVTSFQWATVPYKERPACHMWIKEMNLTDYI